MVMVLTLRRDFGSRAPACSSARHLRWHDCVGDRRDGDIVATAGAGRGGLSREVVMRADSRGRGGAERGGCVAEPARAFKSRKSAPDSGRGWETRNQARANFASVHEGAAVSTLPSSALPAAAELAQSFYTCLGGGARALDSELVASQPCAARVRPNLASLNLPRPLICIEPPPRPARSGRPRIATRRPRGQSRGCVNDGPGTAVPNSGGAGRGDPPGGTRRGSANQASPRPAPVTGGAVNQIHQPLKHRLPPPRPARVAP